MTSATCSTCNRVLREGESAWASDWTVIGDDYRSARRETRYTCHDCHDCHDPAPHAGDCAPNCARVEETL